MADVVQHIWMLSMSKTICACFSCCAIQSTILSSLFCSIVARGGREAGNPPS